MFICSPLVVSFGTLGDTVLLTTLMQRLHGRHGRCCHVLGTGTWLQPLLGDHPDVRAVHWIAHPLRPPWLDPTQRGAWDSLHEKWAGGPVYVCGADPRSRTSGLLHRLRLLDDQCRFADVDCPPRPGEHLIHRWWRFAAMTPPALTPPPHRPDTGLPSLPRLAIDDRDRDDLADWRRSNGLGECDTLLLHPGGEGAAMAGDADERPAEAWPARNWHELTRALLSEPRPYRILLLGTARDLPLRRRIAGAVQSGRVFAIEESLPVRRLMALCEQARGMIALDSGVAQIAAAMGCPLVVLYGSRPASRTDPGCLARRPVRALGGPPRRVGVDEISVDEVLAAWQAVTRHAAFDASSIPVRRGRR